MSDGDSEPEPEPEFDDEEKAIVSVSDAMIWHGSSQEQEKLNASSRKDAEQAMRESLAFFKSDKAKWRVITWAVIRTQSKKENWPETLNHQTLFVDDVIQHGTFPGGRGGLAGSRIVGMRKKWCKKFGICTDDSARALQRERRRRENEETVAADAVPDMEYFTKLAADIMAIERIEDRGDVRALISGFRGKLDGADAIMQFVIAHQFFSPYLVHEYVSCEGDALGRLRALTELDVEGDDQHRVDLDLYCPALLVAGGGTKPLKILEEFTSCREKLQALADATAGWIEDETINNASVQLEFIVLAKELPLIGDYDSPHLYRTLLIVLELAMHDTRFARLKMGTGPTFDIRQCEKRGVTNSAAFNAKMIELELLDETWELNAGELMYYFCMRHNEDYMTARRGSVEDTGEDDSDDSDDSDEIACLREELVLYKRKAARAKHYKKQLAAALDFVGDEREDLEEHIRGTVPRPRRLRRRYLYG